MDPTVRERHLMVERDVSSRGVRDERVLEAMRTVPRHLFLSPGLAAQAYSDDALPLDEGQTISQPYIVALMAEHLLLHDTDRLLEIGTGSGYAAAIASLLCREVYTIERHPRLAMQARKVLAELGYLNVHVREGDGTLGWPELAPYDAILVTAAGPKAPPALLEQLAIEGRLVMPLGTRDDQNLVRIVRESEDTYVRKDLIGVRFVPLIGEQGWSAGA